MKEGLHDGKLPKNNRKSNQNTPKKPGYQPEGAWKAGRTSSDIYWTD